MKGLSNRDYALLVICGVAAEVLGTILLVLVF